MPFALVFLLIGMIGSVVNPTSHKAVKHEAANGHVYSLEMVRQRMPKMPAPEFSNGWIEQTTFSNGGK